MEQWDADVTIWSQRHNGVRSEKRIAVILHTDESAYNHATGQVRMTGWTVDQLGRYNAEGGRSPDRGSYHLGVDNSRRTVRMVNDRGGTWSVGNQGNNIAVHVCMAGTTAHWNRQQWLSKPDLLDKTAEVVAHELRYHNLPATRLNATDLRASRLGWAGHGDCTVAWGSSTNWDPGGYSGRYTANQLTLAGGFPWDHMQTLINKHMNPQQGGITVSEADRIIDFIKGYVGPIGSDTKDVRAQLTGGRDSIPGDPAASYPGWEQLGTNADGHNLTLTDAVAALRRDVADLGKRIDRMESKR